MQNPLDSNHLEQLTRYITQVFKPCILQGDWVGAKSLPLYLQANWTYKQLFLDGQLCLLMWDYQGEQQETAQKLKKAIVAVAEQFTGPVIYGVSDTAFHNRKRLIDQGIAFVVPGKQLYLPFAALDLRESFFPGRQAAKATLGVCAQQLVLLKCSGRWQANQSAQARAEQLGVSKMTVSRAYKELIDLGLAHIEGPTRLGKLEFEFGGRGLWQMALGYLTNPVKQQVSISVRDCDRHQDLFRYGAGEWTLAQQGMLATTKQRCVAVAWADWAGIKKLTGIRGLAHQEAESVQVQLWRYEPGFMQRDERNLHYYDSPAIVDTLSLYLSLRAETDERIQIALEDLLNRFWNSYSERAQ
ncbi:MAG: hypothetical protein V4732_04970 [Pseudomonadota bacterium]